MRQCLLRNPRAIIFNGQTKPPAGDRQGKFHGLARRSMVQGILQNIIDHSLQQPLIAQHRGAGTFRRGNKLAVDAPMLRVIRRILQHPVDHLYRLQGLTLNIPASFGYPVQRQDLARHGFEPLVLAQNAGHQLLIRAGFARQLNGNTLACQRCPKIMGNIPEQVFLPLQQTAQLLRHGIESRCKLPYFVSTPGNAITYTERIVPP